MLLADKDLRGLPGEPDGFTVATEASQFYPALVVIYAGAQTDMLGDRALTAREHAPPKPLMLTSLVALTQRVIG